MHQDKVNRESKPSNASSVSSLKKDIRSVLTKFGNDLSGEWEQGELNRLRATATSDILNLIESVIPEEKESPLITPKNTGLANYVDGWNEAIKDIKSKLIEGGSDESM